jgi:rare lipoprotein A
MVVVEHPADRPDGRVFTGPGRSVRSRPGPAGRRIACLVRRRIACLVRRRIACLVLAAGLLAGGCSSRRPPLPPAPAAAIVAVTPTVALDGQVTVEPLSAVRVADAIAGLRPALETATGEATYYASFFDGRRTASGVVFRNGEPFAAHRTYPFGTVLRVINERNGREVLVTVVDRGPHGTSERARRTIIDLSQSAAAQLDFIRDGRTPVRVEVLEWGGS